MTTTFAWSNYKKATPKNLLRISKLIKRILGALSVSSLVATDNHWITGGLTLGMIVVDELVQFFSDADADATIHP